MMQREACGRPVVLIVEDEILLRWTIVSVIDETGFNASEAGSGVEAISILERRNDVWAVVTDVQMPGPIDGLRLAHLMLNAVHCHFLPFALANAGNFTTTAAVVDGWIRRRPCPSYLSCGPFPR